MAQFKAGDLAVYVVSRGGVAKGPGFLCVGAVVRILFHGHYIGGEYVQVGGCLRRLNMPADYIVCDVDDPEIVAGVRAWQLAQYGDPDGDTASESVDHGRRHHA